MVFVGLNPITYRYLYERGKTDTVPRGFYHAVLTQKEMHDINDWRRITDAKSRRRHVLYKFDRAMEAWSKECTEESIDMKCLLQRIDSDGWLPLTIREQHEYES